MILALIGIAGVSVAIQAGAADIPTTTREPQAVISDRVTTKQVDAMAEMVRVHGYKCDSISGARPWIMGHGFTLHCNSFRYEYEIQDKGGQWKVTVK
jgi:hypothetical protein